MEEEGIDALKIFRMQQRSSYAMIQSIKIFCINFTYSRIASYTPLQSPLDKGGLKGGIALKIFQISIPSINAFAD